MFASSADAAMPRVLQLIHRAPGTSPCNHLTLVPLDLELQKPKSESDYKTPHAVRAATFWALRAVVEYGTSQSIGKMRKAVEQEHIPLQVVGEAHRDALLSMSGLNRALHALVTEMRRVCEEVRGSSQRCLRGVEHGSSQLQQSFINHQQACRSEHPPPPLLAHKRSGNRIDDLMICMYHISTYAISLYGIYKII